MEFNYIAKTKQGETQSGTVEAVNRAAAVEALQARGLIILSLAGVETTPVFARSLKIFQRVKAKDLVSFARQFSTLVSAQVPLLTSLQSLAKQEENKYFQEIIFEVANDVEGGTIFSQALSRHPKVFSDFFVNMVRSGEASGNLENSLLYLADYMEKQYYLTSRVRGALAYPGFILCTFILIAVLMLILVIPKLTGFLQETGQELPFVTKVIIGVSNFMRGWWWLILILLAGGGWYAYYAVKNSPAVRWQWDTLKLKLPIFGKKIFQKIYVARIAENLSTLIQGGLSILQALQVTSEVVGNVVYQNIVSEAKEEVRTGNSLSSSFMKHKEIPPLVSQMIATGEQTGSLDIILKKLAQFYSKEIDSTVDTLSQMIEPILIVLIGGGVALLVASILMPIYNIAGGM
jgi:type IV pilus assembly protein PilC